MIFVTGASGNVGSAIVEQLRDRQIPFRQGSRQAASPMATAHGEIVPFNFLKPDTFAPAIQGCEGIFLLRPPALSDTKKDLLLFIDFAYREGIRQIVFVSVAGAGDNPLVPHHAVEQYLRRRSQGWTILRPGFFAQNLGDAYRPDIVEQNRLFVPAGTGRVAFIDVRDIAEVAITALMAPATHHAQTYTLLGPEALTFHQVAALLSRELGRAIAYEPASIPGYLSHLWHRGLPLEQAIVQTILHVGLRFGQAATIDDTLPKLLGHAPRLMQDYLRDYRHLWLTAD